MDEQLVQYSEQNVTGEEAVTAQAVPAPMVERALRLLDLLSESEEGLTLTDLARALNMSKGSMHGLLKTLESNGAVEQIEERRYVLGARIYNLAQAYIQRAGLRRFAVPAMRRLAARTGETVCLGKVEQKGVRIIECIMDEGERTALRISATRGQRIPLLAAASGKVVLANWPAARREAYLRAHELPQYTAHSITDLSQFLASIEETARGGVGFDHEEYLVGVNAVAAPIYGVGDTLSGLLWIVGFASRFGGDVLANAARQLGDEAAGVSRSLGATTINYK